MLFQMGDTSSEWTGVQFSVSVDIAATGLNDLDKISVTNSQKTQGFPNISSNALDNSTFGGTIEFLKTGSTIDKCEVTIQRKIEREEQTLTDGSIIRIEAGRSLVGTYYNKDTTGIKITVTLAHAAHGLVVTAGLIMASCATLLTF